MRRKGEMEIQEKLAKKLFCIEICGKGERELKEFILGHVIFFFLTQLQGKKKNFLPVEGIQGLLRKAGSRSPALRLLYSATLTWAGLGGVFFYLFACH